MVARKKVTQVTVETEEEFEGVGQYVAVIVRRDGVPSKWASGGWHSIVGDDKDALIEKAERMRKSFERYGAGNDRYIVLVGQLTEVVVPKVEYDLRDIGGVIAEGKWRW